MRPIDADELIKRTKRWAINSREAVQQMIIGCPTIDAVPARHGKWVGKEDKRWHCSECDGIAPKGYRYNYCPDCGAKMDLDEERRR